MNIKTNYGFSLSKIIIWIAASSLLVVGGAIGYSYITQNTVSPIPEDIKTQLTFSPFVIPKNTKNYSTTDYKFSTAEDKVKILSYITKFEDNTISVSEYSQPPEFTEITEYKDRFLSNVINQYDTVQTVNGMIYLGRATKQDNKQLGIMIERGLLVFMSPSQDLNSNEWRNFGDKLEIQKIDN